MVSTNSFIHEGRRAAERLLLSNGGSLGLLGNSKAYQQVWARDSMICSLGFASKTTKARQSTSVRLKHYEVFSRRWAKFRTASAGLTWTTQR